MLQKTGNAISAACWTYTAYTLVRLSIQLSREVDKAVRKHQTIQHFS